MNKSILSTLILAGIWTSVPGVAQTFVHCNPSEPAEEINMTSCEKQYKNVGLPQNKQYSLTPPRIVYDPFRNVIGVIASIISLCNDGEPKAELIAVQERMDGSACGDVAPEAGESNCYWHGSHNEDGGCVCDLGYTGEFCQEEDTRIDDNAFRGSAYTYVKAQLLDKNTLSNYQPLQSHLGGSGADFQQAIISTFFAPSDANTATEAEYARRRQEYGELITTQHVVWGSQVQQRLVRDIQSAGTAPVTSVTEVGNIAIDGRTLDEMIKLEIVDIAMQIELMEEDAMRYMLHQPVKLLTESWVNAGLVCSGHGTQDPSTGACTCESAYEGSNCERAKTCNGHGTRDQDQICHCNTGWTGENCELDANV